VANEPTNKRLSVALTSMLIFMSGSYSVFAQERMNVRQNAKLPAGIENLKLDAPLSMQAELENFVDPKLFNASGRLRVIVRLNDNSVAKHSNQSKSGRIKHKQKLKNAQSSFLNRVSKKSLGAKHLNSTQTVLNAVFMEIDASQIEALAKDPGIRSIHKVRDYQMDLSETVPYIGASAVQDMNIDGEGVSVAVLDSGIDYYHEALGGTGLVDYAADDPTSRGSTFPTARVVGGWDFVGANWPNTSEEPDSDPLDHGPANGHGTHVADIIGGAKGVAPAVALYAVKVCSSIATSCSGMALIQGIEFAVDPDGDGDMSDRVDIINMSLGSNYGQPFDDDLAAAVDGASALGTLTVASAGNGSDKPYVNGTPAGADSALSVAQTQVPSAGLQLITLEETDYPAVFQPWSVAPGAILSDYLQYADGIGGNLNGCAAFNAGSLVDKVVLVDRGACNFTLKIKNIQDAGGLAGIIGLVGPGGPFSGGDGGHGPITIPGYMVSQADSSAMKSLAGITVAIIDPDNGLPLIGQMVGSSSRGPQHDAPHRIKPEIGSPGASISAIAGTGVATGPFGGTSGAALLLQSEPNLSPQESKARLMNTGHTNIKTDPFSGLAPITRIGGGEVRINDAVAAPAAAWDEDTGQGALSFGFIDVDKDTVTLHKKVRVRNYSNADLSYNITPSFRYAGDEASGAVAISVGSGKVKIKAGKDATFNVKMTIKGELLSGNAMNSGSEGANPDTLTANEYDGYLTLDDGEKPIHLAWHVLPRKTANVIGRQVLKLKSGSDTIALTNNGVGTAQNDTYSLIAISPDMPEGGLGQQSPAPDIRAVGINTFPVPAGFCSAEASFLWAFAVNTWERQEHLAPVSHQIWLDTDQDSNPDFVVLNLDISFNNLTDGRQLTWVYNLSTNTTSAFFFAEHATNTGNTVMLICGEQVGLSGSDMLATNVGATVISQDIYFGGPGDVVSGLTITPLGERYFGIPEDVAGKSTGSLNVIDFGVLPGNSAELGVMMLTNGDRGAGNRGGATQQTEAMLFMVK
jgi:subtilisin family serine protease